MLHASNDLLDCCRVLHLWLEEHVGGGLLVVYRTVLTCIQLAAKHGRPFPLLCVCVRGWVGGWAWSVEADILGRVVLVMEYVCDAKQTLTNSSQGATELVMYVNFFSIARPCGKLHDSTYEECGKLGSANV